MIFIKQESIANKLDFKKKKKTYENVIFIKQMWDSTKQTTLSSVRNDSNNACPLQGIHYDKEGTREESGDM